MTIDAAPDAKEWFDAPPAMFDFSCMGNTAPLTATAQITLSGTVRQVNFSGSISIAPLADATVQACKAGTNCTGGQNDYGTDTSDASGNFSVGPIDTADAPLDAYLWMTKVGSRSVYLYPPQPFVADQDMIPIVTLSPALIAALGSFPGGCSQNDVANGMIALAVTDCADAPITDTANLMLSIKQNDAEVTGTSVIDLGTLQQEAAGTYLICNVPENATTTVGATYKSTPLRAHDVQVVKGTTTTTLLRPGF